MSLPLILISAITTIISIILGLSLKKYQKLSYEKQIENRKLSDEFTQRIKEKESTISQHENQLSDLEQKIQSFDTEKTKIYEQALAENAQKTDVTNDQYKDNIIQLKKYNDQLRTEKAELSKKFTDKASSQINFFKKEISIFQDENFKILDRNIDLSSLQISNQDPSDPDTKISLIQLITASNLEKDVEYIATEKSDENGTKSLSYAIIFAGNANAFIIDGELSQFLINNYTLIKNNADKIKDDLNNTLQNRIDFLSDNNFQSEIINTVNQLDGISTIENITPSIYIPSENISNLLQEINPDFFSHINTKKLQHYTPAGIINLILHAKTTLLAEKNIIRFQILSDIIDNSDFSANDIPQENTENINIADINIEEPNINEPVEENHTTPLQDDIKTDTKPPLDEKTEDTTPNDDPAISQTTIESLDQTPQDINIDKFNIGTFLDGENSNNDIDSISPAETISNIADNIEQENPIDKTLEPALPEETPSTEVPDTNEKVQLFDTETKETPEEENTQDSIPPIVDNKTENTDIEDTSSTESTSSENADNNESPTPKNQDSTQEAKSFKNIDPKDFDIESFLNDS